MGHITNRFLPMGQVPKVVVDVMGHSLPLPMELPPIPPEDLVCGEIAYLPSMNWEDNTAI